MPGTTIGLSLNQGYAGNFSRLPDCKIRPRTAKSEIQFGSPVITNSDGTVQTFGASNTATQFSGVAVREVKQPTDYTTQSTSYKQNETADILQKGACTVVCQNGTPAANGTVYIRIRTSVGLPNAVVGGFEAANAAGASLIALTNVRFINGTKDANNLTEVDILYPINA